MKATNNVARDATVSKATATAIPFNDTFVDGFTMRSKEEGCGLTPAFTCERAYVSYAAARIDVRVRQLQRFVRRPDRARDRY